MVDDDTVYLTNEKQYDPVDDEEMRGRAREDSRREKRKFGKFVKLYVLLF